MNGGTTGATVVQPCPILPSRTGWATYQAPCGAWLQHHCCHADRGSRSAGLYPPPSAANHSSAEQGGSLSCLLARVVSCVRKQGSASRAPSWIPMTLTIKDPTRCGNRFGGEGGNGPLWHLGCRYLDSYPQADKHEQPMSTHFCFYPIIP